MMSRVLLLFCLLSLCCTQSYAEAFNGVKASADAGVVAERGAIKLTLRDIDLAMEEIPAIDRAAFVSGSDRLHQLMDSELLNKQMAQRGREMKLMESPMIQKLVARAAEQELAKLTIDQIVKNTKRPDFNLVAKEYYMANKAEFATPVTSVVQHILISKTGKTAPEILARAQEMLKKAQASGAKFEALVAEYSDDPSKSDNQGVMTVSEPGQFVPTFEAAAHALKAEGDLSEVETQYGTHVLRLVSRKAVGMKMFESMRDEIITKLSGQFEDGIRTKFFSDLRAANPVFHEDMIEAVRKRYGELPSMSGQPASLPTAPAVEGTK